MISITLKHLILLFYSDSLEDLFFPFMTIPNHTSLFKIPKISILNINLNVI